MVSPPLSVQVESRSRPGEFVYENIHTEERQSWFPDAPAVEEVQAPLVAMSADEKKKKELMEKNKAALEKRKADLAKQKAVEQNLPLPDGWRKVRPALPPPLLVCRLGRES